MLNFKQEIAEYIEKVVDIEKNELEKYIEKPKDTTNGDYAFPCFRLAKQLKKAPQIIAEDIKEKIESDIEKSKEIEKVEIVGGYLNFYINKNLITEEVLKEISKSDEYGKSDIGKGKNIVIDYSEATTTSLPFS